MDFDFAKNQLLLKLRNLYSDPNKRLFALFEQGWTVGEKLLFSEYWTYKARLCTRHKWES